MDKIDEMLLGLSVRLTLNIFLPLICNGVMSVGLWLDGNLKDLTEPSEAFCKNALKMSLFYFEVLTGPLEFCDAFCDLLLFSKFSLS